MMAKDLHPSCDAIRNGLDCRSFLERPDSVVTDGRGKSPPAHLSPPPCGKPLSRLKSSQFLANGRTRRTSTSNSQVRKEGAGANEKLVPIPPSSLGRTRRKA